MKNRLITPLLFTLFTIPVFAQTETCLENLDHPNYRSMTQVVGTNTITREYLLHIPTNYDASVATPLVLNLHGFGGCAAGHFDGIGEFYQFNDLANQENFIVAYPQGAYRPEKEDTYWEPGDPGVDHLYENDVYFLEQLVAHIDEELNIDLQKVYACGYSNGGMMSYSLGCNSGDVFSAIGIMSGTMLEEECTLDNPVPLVIFHGTNDFVLPYDGNIWYQSVAEIVDFWLDLNGIPASSLMATELNDGEVNRDEYSGGDEDDCVTLYTIINGGHDWFSEEIDGKNPNQILWDFFTESCSPVNAIAPDFSVNFALAISPNPFVNQINITVESPVNQRFNIYNMQGILELSGMMNGTVHTIDLAALSPNVYFLEMGGVVRKIVKKPF